MQASNEESQGASETIGRITLTQTAEIPGVLDGEVAAPERRRFALLVVFESDAQVKLLDESATVVVGRQSPCEVVVADASVSRQHARFVLKDEKVWVEDLDSRNGTFFQGERIRQRELQIGDEIGVGKAKVVLAATRLRRETDGPSPNDYVVQNSVMKELYRQAASVAAADIPVLVLGETGSGKEHVARSVHRLGPRSEGPFVAVNCASIPAQLLESTLFGHERGAFTGAVSRTVGAFERANGGVLFLDEIGELGLSAQASLLRAIETRRVCRVGSSSEIPIDVRIVAATHCDLASMVEEGTFRRDLFFRLEGVQLSVPPLRARTDEIEPLVRLFMMDALREWNVAASQISPQALEALCAYSWPGNVRQLRHAVERAALLAGGRIILVADLPPHVLSRAPAPLLPALEESAELGLRKQVQSYERALIEDALRRAGGNRRVAAKILRVPLRTLFRRMRATALGSDEAGDTMTVENAER